MRKVLAIFGVFVFAAVACSDDGGDSAATDGEVAVTLSEWIVGPNPTSVEAGSVTFVASNAGGEAHELVIVKGSDPEALPIDDTGKVLEDELDEGAFIGEIEEFEGGGTEEAIFDLESGDYILFCNIVEEEDDGTFESHFLEGMVSTFTVT